MRTLKIVCGEDWEYEEAFELLGDLAGLYGDNGGDPDGNAWLPSSSISEDDGRSVIEAGLGVMVDAVCCDSDDAAARWLGIETDLASCSEIEDDDAWRLVVGDKCTGWNIGWAHFGAWLSMDSWYVFEVPTN